MDGPRAAALVVRHGVQGSLSLRVNGQRLVLDAANVRRLQPPSLLHAQIFLAPENAVFNVTVPSSSE